MKLEDIEKNAILKQSFEFSLSVIQYCEKLEANKQFVIARQLLRSGTSIGANSMEAQNAESKADFVHKFKIAAKEAGETQYWLWLCMKSPNYPDCSELIDKLEGINKILNNIIASSKRKNPLSFFIGWFLL
jgi:four helix bundle protein